MAVNLNGVGAKAPVVNYQRDPKYLQLNQQRQNVLSEIHRRGGVSNTPGFAQKLNDLNSQIRGMRNGIPGTGGGLTVGNGATASVPTNETPSSVTPAQDVPASANNSLYPSLNYQLPENYQGSPLYKWQMDQGQTALNRRLAQQGLLGSGAELEASNKLSQAIGAQEADRLRADMQTEADRYERVSSNEANRRINQENSHWGRFMDVLGMLNKQSPMESAYNGLGSYSGLDLKRGAANASNTAGNYSRVSSPSRSVAPFVPPGASSPDYSQIDLLGAMFNNQGSRDRGSIIDSVIGSLGSFLK